MKNLLTLALILAAILTSCQQESHNFSLSAKGLPADLNGKYAFLQDDVVLDSVQISDGSFRMVIDSLTPEIISYINIDDQVWIPFVREKGDFVLRNSAKEGESPIYSVVSKRGSETLNDRLSALMDSVRMVSALDPSGLPVKSELTNPIYLHAAQRNSDNIVGLWAFNYVDFGSDSAFIQAYEQSGGMIKNDESLRFKYDNLKAKETTKVGMPYTDVSLEDWNGNSVKVSDYLTSGKYLLVDLWASWCVPCREAMPLLKDLHKKYGNIVQILSVAVWEKSAEEYAKAVEELRLPWNVVADSKDTITKTYGVREIPTLILISPEGTILLRTHSASEVTDHLATLPR